MALLFCIVITLTCTGVVWGSPPTRGECKREAEFKKESGHALANHVITTHDVTCRHDCSLECLQNPKCVSYNYQETDLAVKKCELSDQTKATAPSGDYVIKSGYSYHDAQQFVSAVCGSSPCLNNAKCMNDCTDDYECECSDGYIGKNCETWIGLNGSSPLFAAKSCRHIKHITKLDAADGTYWINPTNTGSPFQVICDMTTDGGGWTVVKNITLASASPTTYINARTNYRNLGSFGRWMLLEEVAFKNLKNDMGFAQIRYYCRKASVGRVFHIMTKHNALGYDAVRYLVLANSPFPNACQSFTRLPDDTSKLSRNCAKWGYGNAGATLYNGKWGHSANAGSHRMYNRFAYWHLSRTVLFRGQYMCDDKNPNDNSVGDTWKMFVR